MKLTGAVPASLSVPSLHAVVDKLLADLNDDLDKLMLHARASFPPIDLGKVEDDWSSRNVGYGLFSDSGKDQSRNIALLEYALKRPTSGGSDSLFVNGKLVVSKGSAYMLKAGEFNERLAFLFHISAGMPPRSTTALAMSLVNTDRQERGLYSYKGQLLFCARYDKAETITSPKPTIRLALPEFSSVYATYLAYVRPFEL